MREIGKEAGVVLSPFDLVLFITDVGGRLHPDSGFGTEAFFS